MQVLVAGGDRIIAQRLERMLADGGFERVVTALEAELVLEAVAGGHPDLILLDLEVGGRDGLEVLCDLSRVDGYEVAPPVVVVARECSRETVRRALNYGAADFVIWPVDQGELALRVRNHLKMRQTALVLGDRLHGAEADLERERLESVERLALAAEARDRGMGAHLRRIELLTGAIARRLGWSPDECRRVARAARVHDIGKIAIPDSILLKPGHLSEQERERMRTHAAIGADILAGSRSPVLQIAEQIARSHHERWDGGGYPDGLAGERIPIAARVVAVADAFDAMTSERPYRAAGSLADAVAAIAAESGSQFDPGVVSAFLEIDHDAQAAVLAACGSTDAADRERAGV